MSTITTAERPKIHTARGVMDSAAFSAELTNGYAVAAVWYGPGSSVFLLWNDKLVRLDGDGPADTVREARAAFARFVAQLGTLAGAA